MSKRPASSAAAAASPAKKASISDAALPENTGVVFKRDDVDGFVLESLRAVLPPATAAKFKFPREFRVSFVNRDKDLVVLNNETEKELIRMESDEEAYGACAAYFDLLSKYRSLVPRKYVEKAIHLRFECDIPRGTTVDYLLNESDFPMGVTAKNFKDFDDHFWRGQNAEVSTAYDAIESTCRYPGNLNVIGTLYIRRL